MTAARRRRDGRGVREARGEETLAGYRAFIDDWDAFQAAIRTPEPTTLRANVLRTSRDALADRLQAQGFTVEPVPHQPAFLTVRSGPRPVSDTLEHWAGLFYIQQRATGLAAPLLDPRPGERVLDLCSAPGGKTTHLAELMEGRGCVVAADVNETRIRALLGNLYRLGHTNVMTVAGDGRSFPLGACFDRVMVDVPCSAEGTLRRRGGRIPGHAPRWARQVTRAQEKILRRAVELTRPGGTLLYVTCTFGPQENEGVLTRVLADTPLEVEALDLPLPHAPGLTRLGEERFDPRLERAVRLYPHHLDSGGLFLCRLRRPESEARAGAWAPVPELFPGEDPGGPETRDLLNEAEAFVQAQLGVPSGTLDRVRWMRRGSNAWGHTLEAWPVEPWTPGGHWRVVAVGFRGLDLGGAGPPRPTNDLLAWLDGAVSAGRVDLDADTWLALLDAGEVPAPEPGAGLDGLVALCHAGLVLGRGFQRAGVLRHEIPKGRLNWLRSVMAREERPFGTDGEDG
ncbi:MAG: RsmB/NOP family class I SAM-dependent RNA methyltransferase [Longimicrobiales bacterium]|nr:RsmB/NOP family class I SAM-dependent RNA methyltransferase [Longimicrobiales bacterium]